MNERGQKRMEGYKGDKVQYQRKGKCVKVLKEKKEKARSFIDAFFFF